MSQTPDDLSLPTHDAGVLFRAEMAAQNLVLGYWKALVAVVVVGLVGVLIYGQYTSYNKTRQQDYAAQVARIELALGDILPTLAYDPSLVTPADMGKIATAAESLMQAGASSSGPAAAEAYMKAGEIYRLLSRPDDQLDAYTKATQQAKGQTLFAAKAARAALLLDTGASEASVAAWTELASGQDYLASYATLQLARTQQAVGDSAAARASYDQLMSRFPDSDLAETASSERAALSETAASTAPAPSVPAPSEPTAPPQAEPATQEPAPAAP